MKKSVIAIAVCIILAILLFSLKTMVQARVDIHSVEAQLSKFLGVNVRATGAHVSWTGQFALEGVQLQEGSQTFLSADTASLRLHLMDLLRRKISIASLNLQSPKLILDDQSVAALSKLWHQKKTSTQNFPINFSHGQFTYIALNGKKITLNQINGKLTLSPQGAPFQLTLQDPQGGKYDLSGTVAPESLTMQGKMQNIALHEVVTPFGISPIPELQGKIDGSFSVTGPFRQLAIQAQVTEKAGFFKGNAAVNAVLKPIQSGAILTGKLTSSQGEIEGIGAFKGFGVGFSTVSEGLVFQNGTIEFPSGLIQFSGAIGKNYAVNVNYQSGSFNPFILPNFSGWGLQGSAGTIQGKASGIFPNLSVATQGNFPLVQIGQNQLHHVALAVDAQLSSQNAVINRFAFHSPQGGVAFTGKLQWDNNRNLHLSVASVSASQLASLFHLESAVSPVKMMLSGSMAYDQSGKTWKGNVESPAGVILGEPFDHFSGQFSYQAKQPVVFQGIFDMNGKTAQVSGTWKSGEGNFKLDAVGFPIERIPFLKTGAAGFHGIASIHANYSTRPGSRNQINFSLPNASYRGKKIPPVEGVVSMQNDIIRFAPLRFTQNVPPLSLTGQYDMKSKAVQFTTDTRPSLSMTGQIDANTGIVLHSFLNGQSLSDLAKLAGKSFGSANGNLIGTLTISGFLSKISFNGQVKNLSFSGMDLGDADVILQGAPSGGLDVRVSHLAVSRISTMQKAFPGLSGEMQIHAVGAASRIHSLDFQLKNGMWKGKSFPALDGTVAMQGSLTKFSSLNVGGISPPLSAVGDVDSQTHAFHFSSDLKGQKVSDLTNLVGLASARDFNARLYGPVSFSGGDSGKNVRFSGTGKGLRFRDIILGSGHLDFTAQSDSANHYAVHVKASEIPAESVPLLAKHYAGMSGNVMFEADLNTANPNQAAVNFSLTGASLHGRAFPELVGQCQWNAPKLTFSPLSAPKLSPPFSLTGAYDSQYQSISLGGELNGQTLSELLLLAGTSNGEANGKMFGPITVNGPSNAPRLEFHGQVSDLTYKGLQLGAGQLDVAATENSLNGKLVLNNPVAMNPNNAIVAGIAQIVPQLGNIFQSVISTIIVRGVTISGTPQHPQFTPDFQRGAVQPRSSQPAPSASAPNNNSVQNNPVFNILNQILKH